MSLIQRVLIERGQLYCVLNSEGPYREVNYIVSLIQRVLYREVNCIVSLIQRVPAYREVNYIVSLIQRVLKERCPV